MKMAVFLDVALCSLVGIDHVSEVLIALMMETVRTSEMLVSFYWTTQCNIPEDSHLHTCCSPNGRSY
jgi:hypothetical protein